MKEMWKDIPGYEGKYQVSNTGEVKSLNYNGSGKTKLLKQSTIKYGYKRVGLCKNNKQKYYLVHRLVAITFIPNPNDLLVVNHKDENPSNNNVNNLEWCTQKYNVNYGTAIKRSSENRKGEKNPLYGKKGGDSPNAKPILMYDKEGEFIRRFNSIVDVNEYFGKYVSGNVSSCLTGKRPTAYGFIFIYVDDDQDILRKKLNEAKKEKNEHLKKPILMYTQDGKFIRRFDSIADANEYLGKDRRCTNIKMCLKGKYKSAYGYIFRYANDTENTIKNKINKKPIKMYTEKGDFIKRFDSIADANEYLGKDRNCVGINHCLSGRQKTAYGYVFVYAKENN